MTDATESPRTAVLGYSGVDRLFVLVGWPVLFALIGVGVQLVVPWVLDTVRLLPFGFVFRLVDSFDTPREIGLHLLVWTALGCVVAAMSFWGEATVTVTTSTLTVKREGRTATFPHDEVSAVFVDGEEFVVLDRRSRELAREPHQARVPALAAALTEFGLPWRDGDPYGSLYRPWAAGTNELPAAANAMLALRAAALRRKSQTEARGLRGAVQELGFVLRDEGTAQSWRPLVAS